MYKLRTVTVHFLFYWSDIVLFTQLNVSRGVIDLQESGYYASETMSVSVGDANSEPLSSHYLSNSAGGAQHPLRGRDRTSFDRQSQDFSHERQRWVFLFKPFVRSATGSDLSNSCTRSQATLWYLSRIQSSPVEKNKSAQSRKHHG